MLTKNPMTALERRAVAALSLLYIFRMLGLFMVLPLLALYAVDYRGATPLAIGLALAVIVLTWLSSRVRIMERMNAIREEASDDK